MKAMKRLIGLALVMIMFFALTACGNKDKCAETDPDKTKVTENVSNGDTGSSKDNNIDGFDGVIVLGEKGNLYISYPTDLLKKDGYGGLAPVSDSGIRFKSDVYVYPEGLGAATTICLTTS